MAWERIQEDEDTIVEYDKERGLYRVSFFEDNHFVDDVMFDAYETVKHGFWIDTDTFDANYQPIYQCSACQKQVADNYISCHKYCLHCGIVMDGGNK